MTEKVMKDDIPGWLLRTSRKEHILKHIETKSDREYYIVTKDMGHCTRYTLYDADYYLRYKVRERMGMMEEV